MHQWDIALELEGKKKKEKFLGELNLEMEQKKTLFHITTKPWGKHIPKLAEADTPNQGEMQSQILYNEPHGLNTDKDLPTINKDTFKKGVYY